jgi:hypothetical protein
MRKAIITMAIVIGWTVVTTAPSIGADGGTVNATVSTPSPCMTLDRTSVDFGILPFVTGYEVSGVQGVDVTNCAGGGIDETLLVSATDAASTTSATVWSLSDGPDPCLEGIDIFRLAAANSGGGGASLRPGIHKEVGSVPAAAPATIDLSLTMPCEASNGQGETFGFDVTFLVAIP